MLTDDEKAEIISALQRVERKQAACLDALLIVQRHRGWVSDEIGDIAGLLGITADEIDSVASFFSLIFRRPVGKHVILICDSISCWITGYERILDHLKMRIGIGPGETSSDGQFTLLPVACLGTCDHAPSMMINDRLYKELTPEKVDEILEQYR
jgi:NADH-quinone oxidoreductase subunit E